MPLPKSPVVPGLEPYEIVYAEHQLEYIPLPTLRSKAPNYTVYSRWEPTEKERVAILHGADIYILQQTFGHLYQPTAMIICKAEDNATSKEAILEALGLDEELNERIANAVDTYFKE